MTQELTPEILEAHGFKGHYYPGEGWQGSNGDIQCLLPHGYLYLKYNRIPGEIYTVYQLETLLNLYSHLNIKTMQPGPGQETTTVETTETTTVEKPTETTTTTTTTTESPSE